MPRILVPTDFSGNSKAGMRFAIRWSSQQKNELIFFHVFHGVVTSIGSDYGHVMETRAANELKKLKIFVAGLYKSMHFKPGKYSCVAIQGTSPDISVMDYCRNHNDIDYICISTRGAGKINRILGTNTGNLISKSKVPVIAIPKDYRNKSLKNVLYATDLADYSGELKKVEDFTRPFKANIEIVHLTWPGEILPDKKMLEKSLSKNTPYREKLKIGKADFTRSLIKNLQELVNRSKPSLIVMFTDQHRNLIQRIFFPSKAEQLSFTTKIPLLAFQKV